MVNWIKKFFKKEVETQHFRQDNFPMSIEARATHAKRALDNPVLMEVMEHLKREALSLWENTSKNDIEKREFFWSHLKTLNQIKGKLERYLTDYILEERKRQSLEKEP